LEGKSLGAFIQHTGNECPGFVEPSKNPTGEYNAVTSEEWGRGSESVADVMVNAKEKSLGRGNTQKEIPEGGTKNLKESKQSHLFGWRKRGFRV